MSTYLLTITVTLTIEAESESAARQSFIDGGVMDLILDGTSEERLVSVDVIGEQVER